MSGHSRAGAWVYSPHWMPRLGVSPSIRKRPVSSTGGSPLGSQGLTSLELRRWQSCSYAREMAGGCPGSDELSRLPPSGRHRSATASWPSLGIRSPVLLPSEPRIQGLGVLAGPSIGEARASAANMAPGAHPQLEVAPRLVGPAAGQVAVLAGQLDHPDAAGPGLGSLQLL